MLQGKEEGAVNRRNCSLSNVCGGERESMIAPMSLLGVVKVYEVSVYGYQTF